MFEPSGDVAAAAEATTMLGQRMGRQPEEDELADQDDGGQMQSAEHEPIPSVSEPVTTGLKLVEMVNIFTNLAHFALDQGRVGRHIEA